MELWWGPFIQSRKCMSLKFTGEFCVMTMKNDTKTRIDLSVQNWHEEFDKFWSEHSKSYLHFNKLLSTKVYNVWAKEKYRGVIFDSTEDWCKSWKKTDLCFLKILVYRLKNSNFILESKMSELNWKQNFLIYFENCQDVPNSHE